MMECLRALRQWRELGEVAREVHEQNPADHEATNYLGWATLKQGSYEEATNLFFRAIEADEHFFSAWLGLGYATLYLRELKEAVAAFSSAATVTDVTPDPPKLKFDAFFGLGLAYVESGMPDKALDIGNRMDSDNRIPAATGIVRARAFFALGMPEAGITEGELAISQGAENAYLLIDMALTYARIGDVVNALHILDLIDEDEAPGTLDDYQIRCGKTTVQLILERHDEAIAITEKLVEDFGKDENLLNMLGVQYMLRDRVGDKIRARRYFDEALQHSRDDLILTNRAILLAEAGATRAALDMTREALAVAKTAPRSIFSAWTVPLNLARYTAQLGDIAGAKKLLMELAENESLPDWVILGVHQQLEQLNEGDAGGEGPGTLPPVSGTRHAELVEREQRQTVRLFERLVCDECEKNLGWHSCEAEHMVPELARIGDLDVYGFIKAEGEEEVVCVGECKLRFENENSVDHSEMNQLVSGKLKPLRQFMDAQGDRRRLQGLFFANADYDDDARELARREGVHIFEVKMSRGWKRRDAWKVHLEVLEN
jgi:tetratricopeptide (TPR) repeat protein